MCRWLGVLGVAAALLAPAAWSAGPADYPLIEADGPVRTAGFVGFIQTDSLPAAPLVRIPGVTARTLSEDEATGRAAYVADFPADYHSARGFRRFDQSIEFVVLDGELAFGDETLRKYDFAFVPPGGEVPELASSKGARALVFFDPPVTDDTAVAKQRAAGSYVTHFEESRWHAATVARDAGHPLDLAVQDMKHDPATTARTWYVRGGPSLVVPWERHSVVEEGYLVEGDYRLPECLPQGEVIGTYRAGGYFRRPPEIIHSGPDSGTKTVAIWLIRSYPAKLDVKFEPRCRWSVPSVSPPGS